MNLVLFVIGAVLVYWLQVVIFKVTWGHKLRASAVFADNQITEGDMTNLMVTVENQKLLPILSVKANLALERGLEFQDASNLAISDKNYRSEIFSMRAYERVERDIPLFCAKRGYYLIDAIDLVGNDLFYTHRFLKHENANESICVYPGKADARQLSVATQKMIGETVVRVSDCDDPFTFRGIREYQSFDSIRDINWIATAKTGDLRVNVHDFTADEEIAIILDTQWDSLIRSDALLEESIRIASSLADEFIGRGIVTSMFSNGKDCLTGEEFRIGGGSHPQHSLAISYGLARVALEKQVERSTIVSLIKEQTNAAIAQQNRKITWVLISTETSDEVVSAFEELGDKAAVSAYWIIPAHSIESVPDALLSKAGVFCWEVPYGK